MEKKTIYLPKKLIVDIHIKYNQDNIEVSFNWNKDYKELPYDEEKKYRMDGCTLEKNNLVMKLLQYLLLVKNNKKNVELLVKKYLNMPDHELIKHISVTPIMVYRECLESGLVALKNASDYHLGLIELIELLWI